MNRVKHCLAKMNELVNSPGKKDTIDLDLLLDYTKIMYAELLEQHRNLLANQMSRDAVIRYKNDEPNSIGKESEASIEAAPQQPAVEAQTTTNNESISDQVYAQTATNSAEQEPQNHAIKEDTQEIQDQIYTQPQLEEDHTMEQAEKDVHLDPNISTSRTPSDLESVGINFENPRKAPTKAMNQLVDLRKLISLNDKFAYVIELFNGSNEEYEDSINTLNAISTYGNSMEWVITHLQNKYNWNVESALVLKFYDAIKSRFDR